MISIIAAIGRSNELGMDNNLIWKLPSDQRFFKEKTMGHTLIMGHKTYDSLGGPLPGRHHVVITHVDAAEFPRDVEVIHNFVDAYTKYRNVDDEVFVIGGGEIYRLFYSYCDRMYITHINEIHFNADTFFPTINEEDWDITPLQTIKEEGMEAVIKQYDRKEI